MEAESLSLFLASPSGLDEYRRAARECAEQVRRSLATPAGVGFELVGWEDVLPGFGRPQGVINPVLDGCNVLVGILGNRLGTPTGEAESGFVEELERMAERARGGEDVQILIYTLALGEAELDDPGEKLRRVLDFRERLRGEALLRADVDGLADFRSALTLDLMRLVGEAVQRRPPAAAEAAAPVDGEEDGPASERVFDGPGDIAAEAELRELFTDIAAAAPEAPGSFRADRLPLARIALWLSGWQTWLVEGRRVGVHELNLVYKNRARVTLSTLERRQVLRALCAEPGASPGWALVDEDPRVITRRLLALGREDSESAVVAGSFEALGAPEFEEWLAAKEITLANNALFGHLAERAVASGGQAASALIGFAVRLGGETGRAVLAALAEYHEDPRELREGRVRLEAAADPALALALGAVAETEIGEEALRALAAAAQMAGLAEVQALAAAPTIGARVVVAEALASKGELAAPALQALLADAEDSVALVAFESLQALGAPGVDLAALGDGLAEREGLRFDAGLRLLLGRRKSTEELLAEISWTEPDTAGFYQALAEDHFDEFAGRLRRDLADGFEAFKAESRERELSALKPLLREAIEAADGENGDEDTAGPVQKYRSYLEGGEWNERVFTIAALRGIALHGIGADAELVRPRLSSEEAEVREAAATALGRVGGAEDVEPLVALVPRRGGELFARAALAIAPGPGGAADLLLDVRRSEAAIAAARHLHADAGELPEKTVDRLLGHPTEEVRRIGVAVALARAGEDDQAIEELIDRVLAGDTYFYNVVALLDRVLHAPPDLRARTRSELETFAASERPAALRGGRSEPFLSRLLRSHRD